MKKLHILVTAIVGASMYMLGQAQVNAGMLAGQQVTPSVTYEFLDCQRPYITNQPVYDVASYQKAIETYNGLVTEVNVYLSCIRHEAEGDIQIQTTVIREAYVAEAELIRLNLNEMRTNMDRFARTR